MPNAAPADERPRNTRSSGELMSGTAWYGTRRESRTATTPPRPTAVTTVPGESRVPAAG
ncbi:hypothetical protein [Actinoplanes sp. NPDC049265]|uniref:hypothetical protein n=1 Tax=Actinoplanes sp. NPDC049265 TaxID=3363902 RepID=UPI003711F89C